MEERNRFKNQTLSSKDYEKVEESAKLLKSGAKIALVAGFCFTVVKKYGPTVIKSIKKLKK